MPMLKALENNLLPPNPSSQPLQHRHHTVVETKKSHDIEEIYRSRCVGLIDDEFWINEDSLGMEGPNLTPDQIEFIKGDNASFIREREIKKKTGKLL